MAECCHKITIQSKIEELAKISVSGDFSHFEQSTLDESPKPQLAPRDGSTPDEITCINLSYQLYLLEWQLATTPQERKQAWLNYLANYNECYGE